ncbi:MAG: hypothetical protein FD156_2564 [Nitrospirae bacterium]|nr:MAG: hypothetical protein FD156_2564 [Nitrospirota bacterium]
MQGSSLNFQGSTEGLMLSKTLKAGYGIFAHSRAIALRGILPLDYFIYEYGRNIGKIKPLKHHTLPLLLICFFSAVILLLCSAGLTYAADIKVSPSATRVSPGENFYIDINVENIPSEGLGAVQFRLNIVAQGSNVSGVSDTSQGKATDISVSAPLLIGLPTANRSGIGDFFLNATGPNGILVMDNEPLNNGSALYTFGHTNGSTPSSGGGSVARFHFAVGKDVAAEKIVITLSDVMLLDTGVMYPLDTNTGATIELRCITKVPNLLGLSRADAQAALQAAGLLAGNIYEIDNQNKIYSLNQVLIQLYAAGTSVICETPVDLAINTAPSEVGNTNAADKPNDESGGVILSWTPSISSDTAGYRVYLDTQLLTEIRNPSSTGTEISGLPVGQVSQLKITAFDSFGNESSGVTVSATAVDDVAPRITIDGVVEGAFYSSSVLPSISVIDSNLSAKEILLNGIAYAMAAIGIEGNYTLKVTATDSSGNTTTKEIHFVIDKTPPSIAVSGIEKGRYYNTDVIPVITVTEPNLQNAEFLLNGSLYGSGTLISAEGAYELKIEALDKAGNKLSDTYVFYIDKAKPISGISTGTPKFENNGSVFVTGSTMFTLAANDEGIISSGVSKIEYRVNGGDWSAYGSPFNLSGIADGTVTVDHRASDIAGNIEDYHTLLLKADNTPPDTSLNIGMPNFTGADGTIYIGQQSNISLSASDALSGVATTEYRIDGGAWISYGPFTITAEGSHTIEYRSADNVGNIETAKSITVIIDNTPPVTTIRVGDPKYAAVDGMLYITGNTLFTLSATDNLSDVAVTEYRIDGGAWITYALFNIPAEGAHIIESRSIDNVGNAETEVVLTVISDNTPPATAITVGHPKYTTAGTFYVSGNTTFTLTSSDNLSGVSKTEYRIDGGQWLNYATFNLPSEGSHVIGFRSTDNLGNTETERTIEVITDNTPPVSSVNIGVPQYSANGNTYIGGNTEITITASDAGSGINKTEYSIDNSSFIAYVSPLNLAAYSEGNHTINYRSIDNLGTTEDAKTLIVIVDKTPPQTAISASDPLVEGIVNTISPRTRFTLSSSDNLSGVKEISCKIDSGAWQPYIANFSLSGLAAGAHTITYKAMDNVLNEEIEKTITVRLIVIDVQKGLSSEPVVLAGVWTDENGSDTAQKQADMNNLNSVLSSLGLSYYMAPGNEEFVEAVRSGRYNTYLLVDYKEPLLGKEIRESVYYGSGLIFIKTSPQADPFLDDVFGVKFTGKTTSSDLPVNLVESPISASRTINSSGKGVISTITSNTAQSFGYVIDKRNTFDSIVSNQYGRGKTILYNFDLLYTTDHSLLTDLISNSLNYVKPIEQHPSALDSMPVKISVDNSTEPVDIKLIETIPAGTSADSISPNASVTGNTITWQKYLNISEKAAFRYYLNIPDASGDYTTDTELRYSNNGEYRLYGNYSLNFNVPNNSGELLQAIISSLGSIPVNNMADADRITKAVTDLSAISANASSRKEAEQNIRLITNATDEIRKLSFDISDVRLKLDELLRIWEKKWYLMEE